MEVYWLSLLGVLARCLLSVVLAVYSGFVQRFAGALARPVVPADDDNRLYRIDRVHMNSVEALAPFIVPAVPAMMAGVGAATLTTLV
ncbi:MULTISPECIES: MAPEG family protein [unclassified Mesorhizobium]|uniref:MAPEG family protein n=1 Tax=unclassified Mesorhizobium TaxID=325217 RepID=UPI00333A9A2B